MQHFRNLYRQAEFGDRYLYKAGDKIVVNGTTYMVMSYPRLEMDWRELRSLIVQKACEHRLECGVCKDLLWPEHISFLDHIRGRLQSSVPLYVDDLFKDIVVLAKKDGKIFDAWFFKRYVRIFHRTCIEKNGGVKVFQKSGSRYSFDMLDRLFLLDDCCPLDGPVIEKRTFRLHQIRRHKMPYGLRWSHPKYVRSVRARSARIFKHFALSIMSEEYHPHRSLIPQKKKYSKKSTLEYKLEYDEN